MEVQKVIMSYLEENCYLLVQDKQCLIVDPGDEDDYRKLKKAIGKKKVLGVLITHRHFDHIGALKKLLHNYDVPVYEFATCEEKEYQVGPFTFKVIFNPGHSKDSISFYFPKTNQLFVGDFVFCGSIGRCDLTDGSLYEMGKSIEKLRNMFRDVIIFPGHGEDTTLAQEDRWNPYF